MTELANDTEAFDRVLRGKTWATIGDFNAAWKEFEEESGSFYNKSGSCRYAASDPALLTLEYKYLRFSCKHNAAKE